MGMCKTDNSPWGYSRNNVKPPLQMTVPVAKGSKELQARIAEISRLGRLFDKAQDPRLKPRTIINKLYLVRRGYVDAGFEILAKKTTALIGSIKEKIE